MGFGIAGIKSESCAQTFFKECLGNKTSSTLGENQLVSSFKMTDLGPTRVSDPEAWKAQARISPQVISAEVMNFEDLLQPRYFTAHPEFGIARDINVTAALEIIQRAISLRNGMMKKKKKEPLWRADLRCGTSFPLKSGKPSQCDPNSAHPCCSGQNVFWTMRSFKFGPGWCGGSSKHCECKTCTDFRK